jgi:hypothetical protein
MSEASNKTPWESYDSEIMSNVRHPDAPDPIRFHEESSSQNKEELARQKEFNVEATKKFRWEKQEELEMAEIRRGRILSSRQFMGMLQKIPGIHWAYRDAGLKGTLGLWISKNGEDYYYTTWVQDPWMTEYSIMWFDDHGVPLNERYRGWRTPLLQLQLHAVITEQQVEEIFGKATGPASDRYNRQIYGYRHRNVERI